MTRQEAYSLIAQLENAAEDYHKAKLEYERVKDRVLGMVHESYPIERG